MVDGLECNFSGDIKFCEPYVNGKHHRNQFSQHSSSQSEKIVHSDVCGKLSTKSLCGAEYFLTFIGNKTLHVWVYMQKHSV